MLAAAAPAAAPAIAPATPAAVSYTHLDVYKRQDYDAAINALK